MRICFSISGQIRPGSEKLLQLIKQLYDQNHCVYVTLSTWSSTGKKVSGAFTESQLYRLFSPEVVRLIPREKLGTKLPAIIDLDKISKKGADFSVNEFIEFFSKTGIKLEHELINSKSLDLSMESFDYDENSLKSLYLAWRSGRLRKKLEIKYGEFDLVVKVRPDLSCSNFSPQDLFSKINSTKHKRGLFIPDYGIRDNFVHDIYAVGDSYSIYCLEKFFGYCILNSKNWEGVHQDLYKHIKSIEKEHSISIYNAKDYGANLFITPQSVIHFDNLSVQALKLPQLKKVVESLSDFEACDKSALDIFHEIYSQLLRINGVVDESQQLSLINLQYMTINGTSLILSQKGDDELAHIMTALWNLSCLESDDKWLKRVGNNKYFLALQYAISIRCKIVSFEYRRYSGFLEALNLNSSETIDRLETRSKELIKELSHNSKIIKHAEKVMN